MELVLWRPDARVVPSIQRCILLGHLVWGDS